MEKSLIIANNVRKFYVGISRVIVAGFTTGGEVRKKLRGEMRGDKKPRCTLAQLAFASSVSSKISPTSQRRNFNPDLTLLTPFARFFCREKSGCSAKYKNRI